MDLYMERDDSPWQRPLQKNVSNMCKQTKKWCETHHKIQNLDRAREGGIQKYDLLPSLGLFFCFRKEVIIDRVAG